MIQNATLEIRESGARLDAALVAAFPATTRALVRGAVAGGAVLVNGCRAVKGAKLRAGDVITVSALPEAADNAVAPAPGGLAVVFEDSDLLAFDKPAGVPVQPLDRLETGTLMNAVAARYPECRRVGDSPLSAGAVHRIDADTSGLVIVARNDAAFENLRAQFAARAVRKTYLALVEGDVAVGGTLENDLAHDPTLPFCRMIDANRNRLAGPARRRLRAMHAVTEFKPVGRTVRGGETLTLLEITIYTGVTHQIRAQLAFAGMHIVNDRLYGAFAVENMTGHRLHALAAAFTHPSSGMPAEIHTGFPPWAISI
ncbi:MAG: RluA family pseudouridine synthase [Kiritimatiellae bacterium]|nr:RluA family pseudouridine synthase [Kiritimatiellia bacterium]